MNDTTRQSRNQDWRKADGALRTEPRASASGYEKVHWLVFNTDAGFSNIRLLTRAAPFALANFAE
jgi:hypothetical protein